MNRRQFFQSASVVSAASILSPSTLAEQSNKEGNQRLSIKQLHAWEAMQYGMFIHFGMSTFTGKELPDGSAPSTLYAPDKLDVDQWVSVARDAGMTYMVLTAKHVAGHCLWPSKYNDYHVGTSSNQTDVIGAFVESCRRRGIKPGLYYCSWDNHNRFGSQTPSDGGNWNGQNSFPRMPVDKLPPFTTSLYHHFQTAQITELLTQYGPIFETWIDIPGVLGRGYRTFLYEYIAKLQPETVIMMNSGIGDGTSYNVDYAWPSDIMAIERKRPPEPRHKPWREIESKKYCIPAEHCDPIGKAWFWEKDDKPRSEAALTEQFLQCRNRGVNLLLNVPPDKHGLIPVGSIAALKRLRNNVDL